MIGHLGQARARSCPCCPPPRRCLWLLSVPLKLRWGISLLSQPLEVLGNEIREGRLTREREMPEDQSQMVTSGKVPALGWVTACACGVTWVLE